MPDSAATTIKRHVRPVPHEGEEGLFRQSWYAVCKSDDLPRGAVIGRPFLDGRVVAYRGIDGVAQVLSAYCPHIGADLGLGTVVGNSLRCAFHHWEYGRDGRCERTGIGDPAPPTACLFNFPTVERFGVVWAFNGETPLFELAEPTRGADTRLELVADPIRLDTDPWIVCANTPDWAHFAMVHRFDFPIEGQSESVGFEPYGVTRAFSARLERGTGPEVSFNVVVRGTGQVLIEGTLDERWFAVVACMGIPEPGQCEFFVTTMIDRAEYESGSAAEAALVEYAQISARMGAEDSPIWDSIHFKPGTLTRSDKALARYLDDLRAFPRAHPSADFIN
jgi:phenylpropionate dioxygenase-like ring-hydroxylating dioxygenase large terminal subunit